MIKKKYPVKTLVVEREEGMNIDGVSMSGTGTYDAKTESFVFAKTPRRQKSAPKNPAEFTGNHASMRLQQNGDRRITVMLRRGMIVKEVHNDIMQEVEECIKKVEKL